MSFIRSSLKFVTLGGLAWTILQPQVSQAQTSTWTVPLAGYLYDHVNQDIRPITGYLGSATLGPGILNGIGWASVAPNQKSAIVQTGGATLWIGDLSLPEQTRAFRRLAAIRDIRWSSDSNHAVVLEGRTRLIWLGNIGVLPTEESNWDLDGLVPRALTEDDTLWSLLAVDNAAQNVLLASNSRGKYQLWLASPTTPPISIPFPGQPAAAAFADTGLNVFVADSASHQILQTSSLGPAPAWSPLVVSATYINQPVGLVLSADGASVFYADSSTNTVRAFSTATGTLSAELTADAIPQGLTSFSPGVFLLNTGELPAAPFLFLETSAPPAVLFVPRSE